MTFNPSSRGKITTKVFDYGSYDNGERARKELEQHIAGIKGSALVHILSEDCCYTLFEGTEEDLKIRARDLLFESSENSMLAYYHNGKKVPLKIEIEI